MKKQWCCLLALLLCISLIFIGCEKDIEEKPLAETSSETAFSETDTVEGNESAEEQTATELIQPEESNSLNADVDYNPPYYGIAEYTGVVVRWGSVIGGRNHPDFPKEEECYGYDDSFSKLFMVNVEVLDVVEYEFSYQGDIDALDKVFLPEKALEHVVEGEEAIIFINFARYRIKTGDEWIWLAHMDPPHLPWYQVPIFRYEDGRMMIDESQLEQSPEGNYYMLFLNAAYRASAALRERGVLDEKYYFHNGMTIEELKHFYYRASLLP